MNIDINVVLVVGGIALVFLGISCWAGAYVCELLRFKVRLADLPWPQRFLAGLAAMVLGMVLVFSGRPGDAGPVDGPPTGSSTADGAGTTDATTTSSPSTEPITIDTPSEGETVPAVCTTDCIIELSGRLAADIGEEVTPYALIAYDGPSDADEFWVQYDSTARSGSTWRASAYVAGASPGDAYLLRAVLVRGDIRPPGDDQGLLWEQAVGEQRLEVVAESTPVRVTI